MRQRPATPPEPLPPKRARPSTPAVLAPAEPAKPSDRKPPKQWENGSAFMRGPHDKRYKPHPHLPGALYEDNPNLIGRVHMTAPTSYEVWRWSRTAKSYAFIKFVESRHNGLMLLSNHDRV